MKGASKKAISQLLNRAAADPYEIFSRREVAETPEFCRAFLEQCDTLNFDDPSGALERGFIAREICRQTQNRHLIVAALTLVGTGYRIETLYDRAEEIYVKAEEMAEGCPCCLPGVYCRRGMLIFYREAFSEALTYFDEAISLHEQNANSDGIGRVLIQRGIVLSELNRIDEAIENTQRGLTLLEKETPPLFSLSGLANLVFFSAAILRKEGDASLISEALDALVSFRRHLQNQKQKYGFERVRAVMRWCEGLIRGCLGGYENRHRAMQALEVARKNFKQLGLMTEFLLVSADLAKLYLTNTRNDNSRQVSQIASTCLTALPDGHPGLPLVKALARDPSVEAVERLRDSSVSFVPALGFEQWTESPPLPSGS